MFQNLEGLLRYLQEIVEKHTDQEVCGKFIIMSPPFKVGRHIFLAGSYVYPCVRLSHKSCPLYNLKTVQGIFMKPPTNINQH